MTVHGLPAPRLEPGPGGLCPKGFTAAQLLTGPARLTSPLARDRRDAPLRAVSWDDALSRVADGLARASAAHGADAAGVFGGGGLTNEKAYLLGKFARVVLRTRTIDYNGRFCMSSAAAASQRAFGLDRFPFPLADLEDADVIVLVGSNLAETMPPALRHLDAQRERGGRLIVVDPRKTITARAATIHLQPLPGADLALANGLLHVLVEAGACDTDYIAKRTTGFESVRAAVAGYWPERVERAAGVPADRLRAAAGLLAEAGSVVILTARGAEQHSSGTDTALAWINLALALGQPGRPYGGFGSITGQGNGQGGREHGQKADQLPGYRKIDDPAARGHVAGVWGVNPDSLPGPGPSAYELLDSLGRPGGVRALLVAGSNPVVSAPRAAHVTQRLHALDFLAVSDLVLSETAALADVVLPCAQWAEETGTVTTVEGRVVLRRAALPPPPGVRTDLEILSALAARLGAPRGFPSEPRAVFAELCRASAGGPADYAGMTYERIAEHGGLFWPCPDPASAGTPRLFTEVFPTPDERARFTAVRHQPAAEEPDTDFPLFLTTGRVRDQYQSGAQTRRIPALTRSAPGPFVEVHPALAEALGLADGRPARVVTRRGVATAPVRLSDGIRPDTLFMPFHWAGDGRANSVTNPALDPVSRMPSFKVCAARLEAAAFPNGDVRA
jgi:assimilatory nitrate reductase catalytic subunit